MLDPVDVGQRRGDQDAGHGRDLNASDFTGRSGLIAATTSDAKPGDGDSGSDR
jgi:hypothetical protein